MELSHRFEEALLLALRLHADQKKKGTDTPYVAHLLSVAGIAIEYGGDEDEAIAALLHDAVEDAGGAPTREKIRGQFGERVAGIVDGCTDTDVSPKPPWRERKEAYLSHMKDASPSVILVSAADKLHNVRSLIMDYRKAGETLFERFNGGREGTLWYYRSLVTAFRSRTADPIIDELDRAVTELERLCEATQ